MMIRPERCPTCGSEPSADSPSGPCPGCKPVAATAGGEPTYADGPASVGLLETLGLTAGPLPRVLLRDTDPTLGPGPVVRPNSAEIPAPSGRAGRIQLLGEIARGGMGVVLKGRDNDLGRDLAVKVLLERHADNPDLLRRFVEEAQIAGQLQHPGIVPVYELGTFADNRPYFAMKLVKGRTLAEVMADRDDPASDRPRLLAIFLDIAQTMAYAHARGVIHRDLKPSNVMVGSFGEVQVMDWGLAKILTRGGAVDDAAAGKEEVHETIISTARSEADSDRSMAGSILGTPSYMSPEQAGGQEVDERSDVFALGSILCEILTGKPAYTGRKSAEIQRKAARGDLAEALERLGTVGADDDLVALAGDSLKPESEDRPRDAGSIVERLNHYFSGVQERLRDAELARAAESARTEEAKRTAEVAVARARAEGRARRLTATLAALILGLVTLGAAGSAWYRAQRADRATRVARSVESSLQEAARLREEARADPLGRSEGWGEATSAARRASDLLAEGEVDAPLRARVDALISRIALERADAIEKARRLGADRTLLAELETVRGARAVHDNLQRADDEYATAFRKAGLDLKKMTATEAARWVGERSEPAELAGYLDDWASIGLRATRTGSDDWRRPLAVAMEADPDPWRAALRARLGSTDEASMAEIRRLAADTKALDAQPPSGLVLLARVLMDDGIGPDREQAARVLRRASTRHPGDFWTQFEAARAQNGVDTLRHLTAALAIRPNSPSAHFRLGHALNARGEKDEAIAEFREALRLKPDSSWVQVNLYNTLSSVGKIDEEVATCREAVRLAPGDAWAHANLAGALKAQGRMDEAIAEYREVIRLMPDMLLGQVELGGCLWMQGKIAEASIPWREAVRLNPDDAVMHVNYGNSLQGQGKFAEAIPEFREAIRLRPNMGWAHDTLAESLKNVGRHDEAFASFRESLRFRPDHAVAERFGDALDAQGRQGEAAEAYREAVRLKPGSGPAWYKLGDMLSKQGHWDRADVPLREAVRLDGEKVGQATWLLGDVLRRSGRLDEALDTFRHARDLAGGDADTLKKADEELAKTDRCKSLVSWLDDPLGADGRYRDGADGQEFAEVCYALGRDTQAARFYAAHPNFSDPRTHARYNAACSAARAGGGRGKDDPASDEASRAASRKQALEWLKAERDWLAKSVDRASPEACAGLARSLRHWKEDPDFVGIRDADGLAGLPEAEREQFRAFWAGVDALLREVEGRSTR